MKRMLFALLLLASLPPGLAEESQEHTGPESALDATNLYLMQYIGNSGLTFIRNNNKHDAKAALAHVQRKYEYYRDRIESPEQFIELTASRSLVSGRPYEVILADGSRKTMREWLLEALAMYRARMLEAEPELVE